MLEFPVLSHPRELGSVLSLAISVRSWEKLAHGSVSKCLWVKRLPSKVVTGTTAAGMESVTLTSEEPAGRMKKERGRGEEWNLAPGSGILIAYQLINDLLEG
jgi:hypothetical protein